MKELFLFVLLVILIFFFIFEIKYDKFNNYFNYPYNPKINTPMSNYNDQINKINIQNKYKKDLSVGLVPTPTIHCDELLNKESCNEYGCNWFGNFCTAMYPSYL